MAFYVVLSAMCIYGMWPREWDAPIDLDRLYADYDSESAAEIKWRAAHSLKVFFDKNKGGYDDKVWVARWAPIPLLLLVVVPLGAALVVALAGQAP